MTGVLLAVPPVDYLMHNTTFLVAHFHNMLIPGALFGYFAGYMYWFPKATGFTLDERWGIRAFWLWLIGFWLAFMPLYALGFLGMPRRMEHYNVAEWQPYLIAAALGAALIGAGIACLIVQLVVSVRQRKERLDLSGDPWDGRTLEWLTSSPPAPYNFAVVPEVKESDAFHEMKRHGVAYRRVAQYPDIVMPRNTGVGVIVGGLAAVLGFAMVWHIWWLAIVAGLGILIVVALRTFDDDTEFVMSAAEVQSIEQQRAQALAAAPRHVDEHTPVLDAALVQAVP
jgi:cytochrome o ubiquinol oxidase subunit 1